MKRCKSNAPQIAKVCSLGGSWPTLWDAVQHLGSQHTTGLQNLSRMLAHHGKGSKPCPLCEEQFSGSLTDHVLSARVHCEELQLPLTTREHLLTLLRGKS